MEHSPNRPIRQPTFFTPLSYGWVHNTINHTLSSRRMGIPLGLIRPFLSCTVIVVVGSCTPLKIFNPIVTGVLVLMIDDFISVWVVKEHHRDKSVDKEMDFAWS